MKILVIGNGFDLAHYLPTKYSQFISVLQAIEKLPDNKEEIDFNDLFADLSIGESWFFDRTKELYVVDEIRFDLKLIRGIKEKLRKNVWYAYFKHHLAEIETWIDFETKIEEALVVISNLYQAFYEKKKEKGSNFNTFIEKRSTGPGVYLDQKDIDHLLNFNLISVAAGASRSGYYINPIYLDNKYKVLKFEKVLGDLKTNLDAFIEIFDSYLSGVVSELNLKTDFIKFDKIFDNINLIYSFNYTSTFLNLYPHGKHTTIDFLHGQSGNKNKKLVLGISKLPNDLLTEYKAYGFVKYHQKLFNNTDYKFLSDYASKLKHDLLILKEKKEARSAAAISKSSTDKIDLDIKRFEAELKLNMHIVFWGHSLDKSDKDYIKELFSLQDDWDFGVTVSVYFHDASAKFSMLANLIHILGNLKVEQWMKRGWLKFEPAPDIYKLNCPPQKTE
jgi:hypothetical protein